MIDWITIKKFCADTGYTDDAVRSKLSQGIWREGIVWRKAPDGRVLISISGYNAWAEDRVSESLSRHHAPACLAFQRLTQGTGGQIRA